jgi:hypothetical protein
MAKKSSPGMDDFYDAAGRTNLSKKEMKDLTNRIQGKVNKGGDIKAGLSDLIKGRKGAQGVGPAPEPRKGRSMW